MTFVLGKLPKFPGFLLFVGGCLIMAFTAQDLSDLLMPNYNDWITVTGQLKSVDVWGGGKAGEGLRIDCIYSYPVVDKLSYVASETEPGAYNRKDADKYVAENPKGTIVHVRYNPYWPSQSLLFHQARPHSELVIAAGLYGFGLALTGLVLLLCPSGITLIGFCMACAASGFILVGTQKVLRFQPPLDANECLNNAQGLLGSDECSNFRALDYCNRSLALHPKRTETSTAHGLRALCYAAADEYKRAVDEGTIAISTGFESKEIYAKLGDCYEHLGDRMQAVDAYHKGLAVKTKLENDSLQETFMKEHLAAIALVETAKHDPNSLEHPKPITASPKSAVLVPSDFQFSLPYRLR